MEIVGCSVRSLSEQVFYNLSIKEAFYDLISDNLLDGAEVTCFRQLSEGHEEVVKHIPFLLHSSAEVPAFDRFIYLSLNDRRDDVLDFATLSRSQAEVVDNCNGFL